MLDFGITLKLSMSPERAVALTRQAEAAGFTYGWVFDSHVLWLEPYPLLTLMATNTTHMRLGTCVTNPAVRDPTVTASTLATINLISGGRMDMGIGRGDSSLRVLGRTPTKLAELEATIHMIRELVHGDEVTGENGAVQFPWAHPHDLPVWVAAYGPKALALAGRVADGVILQFADPFLIKWSLQFVREAEAAAGRAPGSVKVMAAAPVWVSDDRDYARDQVRWFPALVSNHVVDLLKRYDNLPPELTTYVQNRDGYDYQKHAEVGSSNAAFVRDDVVDRFCIVGTVEEHHRRLQELRDIGVDQFNIYLMSGDEEATLDIYGREVLPAFQSGVTA